jgi:predicted dienelactone hydrolase
MRRLFTALAALLALCAAGARADVGLIELPASGEEGPITFFYPTAQPATLVQRGPFQLQLAERAAPQRGNGRLVVISHGSGGNAWVHSDFAKLLVDAGFVVAIPLHQGDNFQDMSGVGPQTWKRRPLEISRAIDAVAADPRLAPLLSLDRVGMYGMSAGGHTALTLAGGRWSPALMRKHCEEHLADDFQSCVGLAMELKNDGGDDDRKAAAMRAIRTRMEDTASYGHTDPRIAVIAAEVPYAVDFDMASLAHPPVPLGLVRVGRDAWLPHQYHVDAVLRACASCTLVADVPTAGHGSLLSPQPPGLSGLAAKLLGDPPGFDRSLVPQAHARAVAFMREHLLP